MIRALLSRRRDANKNMTGPDTRGSPTAHDPALVLSVTDERDRAPDHYQTA
ncbi:MAG: hypothetical protein AAF334_04615 [Pseudomonadota bacterium]